MSASPSRSQAGVTVIEVLVASALGLIVIGTINSFNRFQLFSLRNQAVQSDVQMVTRSISDVFARDVRRAGFNPMCNAAVDAVDRAKYNEVTLESDLNGDGALGGTDETVTYRVNSASGVYRLVRVSNGRSDVLVDDIDPAVTRFRFYDQAGNEIPSSWWGLSSGERDTVRRVRLELTVAADAVDPERDLPVEAQLANDVDIRNRHFVNTVSCP